MIRVFFCCCRNAENPIIWKLFCVQIDGLGWEIFVHVLQEKRRHWQKLILSLLDLSFSQAEILIW